MGSLQNWALYFVKQKTYKKPKKSKKSACNFQRMWYYIRALAESGAEQRSLKTEQETSIQKK